MPGSFAAQRATIAAHSGPGIKGSDVAGMINLKKAARLHIKAAPSETATDARWFLDVKPCGLIGI